MAPRSLSDLTASRSSSPLSARFPEVFLHISPDMHCKTFGKSASTWVKFDAVKLKRTANHGAKRHWLEVRANFPSKVQARKTPSLCITVFAILIPMLLHADCLDQLASQELRGRLAGTSEVERAAGIIADGFADQGLVAWPERLDMYHHFVFRHCTGHGRERLAWSSQAKSWNEAPPQMFVVLDASSEAEVEGPLVWAGFWSRCG